MITHLRNPLTGVIVEIIEPIDQTEAQDIIILQASGFVPYQPPNRPPTDLETERAGPDGRSDLEREDQLPFVPFDPSVAVTPREGLFETGGEQGLALQQALGELESERQARDFQADLANRQFDLNDTIQDRDNRFQQLQAEQRAARSPLFGAGQLTSQLAHIADNRLLEMEQLELNRDRALFPIEDQFLDAQQQVRNAAGLLGINPEDLIINQLLAQGGP